MSAASRPLTHILLSRRLMRTDALNALRGAGLVAANTVLLYAYLQFGESGEDAVVFNGLLATAAALPQLLVLALKSSPPFRRVFRVLLGGGLAVVLLGGGLFVGLHALAPKLHSW